MDALGPSDGGAFQGDDHVDVRVIGRDGRVVETTLSNVIVLNVWFAATLLCVSTLTAKPTPTWVALNDWAWDSHIPAGDVDVRRFRLDSLEEEAVAHPLSAWSCGGRKPVRFIEMCSDELIVVSAAVVPCPRQVGDIVVDIAMSTVSLFDLATDQLKQQLFTQPVLRSKQVARGVCISGQSLVIAVSHEDGSVKLHVLRKEPREEFDLKFVVNLSFSVQELYCVFFSSILPSPCGRFVLFIVTGPRTGLVLLDTEQEAELSFSPCTGIAVNAVVASLAWNSDGLWQGVVDRHRLGKYDLNGLLLHGIH